MTASPSRPNQSVIEVKLCELVARPGRFNEELIQVRATVVRGMESTILFDESCNAGVSLASPSESRSQPSAYAFIDSVLDAKHLSGLHWRKPPAPIKLLENEEYRKFLELLNAEQPEVPGVTCISCRLNSVTATFTGRFEYAAKTAIKYPSGKIEIVDRFGFGHLGLWDLQLVLQSVSDTVAKAVTKPLN